MSRWTWGLSLAGLLAGVGIGLALAWEMFPPPPGNGSPAELAAPYQDLWMVLAAQAYGTDGDPAALRRRLDALRRPDLPDRLRDLAEQGLLGNWPLPTVRALAQAAQALGARSPAMVVVLATPVPTRPLPSPTLIPTPSPSPTPAPSPTPSPTASPVGETPTPLPTPTRAGPEILEQQPVCEATPLLRLWIVGPDGAERAGVRLWVWGPGGVETLLTGLKPGMGPGYADVRMQPQGDYHVGVERPEPILEGVTARPCTDAQGHAGWTGWQVRLRLAPGGAAGPP